jgi:integrase
MLFVIRTVLDDLLKQGVVTRNVAALVDRLPQSKAEMQTYTIAETKKVLAAASGERLEAVWHLALCGLRRGEICGIRWADIDFAARTVSVNETNVVVDGRATKSEPKTARGRRTLPLAAALELVLERARTSQAAERADAGAGRLYRSSGYLVVNELGDRLHPDTISDKWDNLVKRAGVRRIRLHDARHTCGTLMHLQGVLVAVIAAWLGHADPAFTMRTYVHSQESALTDAADTLSKLVT